MLRRLWQCVFLCDINTGCMPANACGCLRVALTSVNNRCVYSTSCVRNTDGLHAFCGAIRVHGSANSAESFPVTCPCCYADQLELWPHANRFCAAIPHWHLCAGGAVLCAGTEFSGTFQNCTFYDSSAYEAVTLLDCDLDGGQPCITVSGDSTSATLIDCTLRNSLNCVVVTDGAACAASACRIKGSGASIVVNDSGSHVTLVDCESIGSTKAAGSLVPRAVVARESSVLQHRCTITGFDGAIHAFGRETRIEGHHLVNTVSVSFCSVYAHAHAMFRECDLDTGGMGPEVGGPAFIAAGLAWGGAAAAGVVPHAWHRRTGNWGQGLQRRIRPPVPVRLLWPQHVFQRQRLPCCGVALRLRRRKHRLLVRNGQQRSV